MRRDFVPGGPEVKFLREKLRNGSRVNAELLHAGDESRSLEAHAHGSAISARHTSVGFLKNAEDVLALIVVLRWFGDGGVAIFRHLASRHAQHRSVSKDHGTFYEVFQLANIAWPVPAREHLHDA